MRVALADVSRAVRAALGGTDGRPEEVGQVRGDRERLGRWLRQTDLRGRGWAALPGDGHMGRDPGDGRRCGGGDRRRPAEADDEGNQEKRKDASASVTHAGRGYHGGWSEATRHAGPTRYSRPVLDPERSSGLATGAGGWSRVSTRAARGGAFALLLAYAAAMPLVAGGFGLWFLPEIVALFERASVWAVPLFAVIIAVALALALLPATAMAALAGGLFGPLGLVPAVGAYLLACLALFEVVRRFLQPAVQAAVARSPRGRAAQAELEQATFRIVVLSRLSPALPFALASVLLAVSTVARSTYVVGTLVGMLPRTAAAVAVGAAAERALAALREGWLPATGKGPLGPALSVLAALATFGLVWYAAKAIRRALTVEGHRAPPRRPDLGA